MANLSSAQGTLMVRTADLDALVAFLILHQWSNSGAYYDTTIDELGVITSDGLLDAFEAIKANVITTIRKNRSFLDEPASVRLDFWGTGRWTFENNIDYVFKWIDYNFKSAPKEVQKVLEPLKDLIEKNWYELEYDFVDEEMGCGALYEASILIDKEPQKDLSSELNVCVSNKTCYDYTVENLEQLGFSEEHLLELEAE